MEVNLREFRKSCLCGRNHEVLVKEILIQPKAVDRIASFIRENDLGEMIGIIADTNTYVLGTQVKKKIEDFKSYFIILEAEGLHADERGVETIKSTFIKGTKVLIAMGSGTIHDLTRYIAHEQGIPFISVPTAASVDGFVSTVSAMTWNGFKVTKPGISPLAVFADTDFFAKAPKQLTASGVADLLGKYTALLDWKVAHLVAKEYICDRVVEIEEEAIEKVVGSLEKLVEGEKEAFEDLMYALILSGLAMQMIGNSRPASGAEHHLSHLWEMHVINKEIDALHGEKVGVALGLVCDKYKELLQIQDIEGCIKTYTGLPYSRMKEKFGMLYESIVEENNTDILEQVDISKVIAHFKQIQELIKKLPSGGEIEALLKKVGGKTTVFDIGLDESVIAESFELSPYVRRRLTLMRMMKLIG